MKTKMIKAVSVACLLGLGAATSAIAIPIQPTLMLSSDGGANWTTAGSATPGGLNYNGFVGSWSIGVSWLTISSPAELDLLSVSASSRNAGSLMIRFFETGLTVDTVNGFFKNTSSGTVANRANLSMNTYVDPNNGGFSTIPGTAALLTSQTFFGGFSDTANSSYAPLPAGTFSLMVEATIRLRGAGGTTTFSQSLVDPPTQGNDVPDGGSTLSLLGAALVGLGLVSRSRKAAVCQPVQC